MNTYKRQGSQQALWQEIKKVIEIRNRVMHKADFASKDDAELVLGAATEILDNISPSVVNSLGLHLHNGFRICDDWKCRSRYFEMANRSESRE